MQPRQFSQYRFRRPEKNIGTQNEKKGIDFLKWSSLIAPVLILLGICRLYFYYRWFGLNIVSFLDFGEIITSIFDFLVPFIYYNIPTILIVVAALSSRKKFFFGIWLFVASILQAFIFIVLTEKMEVYFQTILYINSIFTLLVLGYYLFMRRRHAKEIKGIIIPYVATLFIFIFVSSGTVGTQKAMYVINHKLYRNVKIVLKDSTLAQTDSINYYIGNTTNYLFIYHEKIKSTSVMKMERVESIDFPNQTRQN